MEANAFLTKEEEAPLKTCVSCKDQPCIKTGKICDEVEKLLPKPQGGKRNKERHYDPIILERMANDRAFKYWGFAGKKKTNYTED